MTLTFLCGCKTATVLTRENLKTMDAVAIDEEGMLICTLHHQRRQGWRSTPRGVPYSWTPAEVEAFVVFHERPVRIPPTFTAKGEDKRFWLAKA